MKQLTHTEDEAWIRIALALGRSLHRRGGPRLTKPRLRNVEDRLIPLTYAMRRDQRGR